MNDKMSISEMITYSTVMINCQYSDGSSGSGTGFIINLCQNKEENTCIPVIVTNNHVVENSVKTVFEFCKADSDGNPIDTEPFRFTYVGNSWIHHPDESVDLCCLLLAEAINKIAGTDNRVFYIPLGINIIPNDDALRELSAMEDVVMVGYPIGLSDQYNHKPIIRRGITATHLKNNYQGNRHFLVDMACFPGSSGSPIFILNEGTYHIRNNVYVGSRILLVGVLFGGPQFSAQGVIQFANLPNSPRPVVQIPTNLGIAIKASELIQFESIFKKAKES